ncbi:hypothetical protein P7C71_g3248, partial [Lecanoromycetidae sp. Uapishka_2]
MKSTILIALMPLLAPTTATVLCDKLTSVKSNIATLTQTFSGNVSDQNSLYVAYRNLNAATSTLNDLEHEITSTTSAINGASSTLSNLDIQTGCWLGWLTNLESGLEQVSSDLSSLSNKGGQDLMNGNVHNVQSYQPQIKNYANSAAKDLDGANSALSTLNQYNDDVNCW